MHRQEDNYGFKKKSKAAYNKQSITNPAVIHFNGSGKDKPFMKKMNEEAWYQAMIGNKEIMERINSATITFFNEKLESHNKTFAEACGSFF